jgi:hypothetical protein
VRYAEGVGDVGGARRRDGIGRDRGSAGPAFTDDLVEGDLMRPDGDMAMVRGQRETISLIRIRDTFVPEMLKSVENL